MRAKILAAALLLAASSACTGSCGTTPAPAPAQPAAKAGPKTLPEDFPIETFRGSVVKSSLVMGTPAKRSYVASLQAGDSVQEVAAFYEKVLAGMGCKVETTSWEFDGQKTTTHQASGCGGEGSVAVGDITDPQGIKSVVTSISWVRGEG
jgi:hypothetical protein